VKKACLECLLVEGLTIEHCTGGITTREL